jgi:hypothetical protein
MPRLRHALIATLALPLLAACAGILGIDKAELADDKTDSGGGGSGGDTSHPKTLCADYCATAMKNCNGDFELYPDLKFCLAVCAAVPEGARTDLAGNSVGCRLHFAQSAALIEKGTSCTVAGPGGNGVCGDNCDSFCALEAAVCPEIYASKQDCETACATFPVKGTYTDLADNQVGNSFECRLYHVTAAAGIDRDFHCPHTDINNKMTPCK